MQLTSLKKRLGDILVDVGIITSAQLKDALETQKVTGEKLGTILAQKGIINEEVMIAFLGKQCGVSYVSLSEFGEIPQEILKSVPESVVRGQALIPISKEGNTVTVAMSDPFNVFAVDDIKVMTGFDVKVVIASETEIKESIEKHYSHIHRMNPIIPNETAVTSSETILNSIIMEAVRTKASDVHIEPLPDSLRIRFRIDGILHEHPALSKKIHEAVLSKLKLMIGATALKHSICEGKIKTKINDEDVDLMVMIIPSVFGEKVTVKILSFESHVRDVSKLGFETPTLAAYKKYIESRSGLIVITAPVNSGKTTTLYSTLSHINHPDRNIISIEELVHFPVPGITQVQLSQENGITFQTALTAAAKHNPDVLMVDEVSDPATARASVEAALNGQLVFMSLPMDNTVSALTHLTNICIEPYLIVSTLKMILSQRLMRVICPHCKEPYTIASKALHNIGIENEYLKVQESYELWRGKGCDKCNFTGYSGRIAIYEILELDENIRSLLLEKTTESLLRQAALNKGLITLREAAWRKVKSGVSTAEEMIRITKSSE